MYEKVCKNGGAAQPRFSAIPEKQVGVVKMTPPPTRAKVNVPLKTHAGSARVYLKIQGPIQCWREPILSLRGAIESKVGEI